MITFMRMAFIFAFMCVISSIKSVAQSGPQFIKLGPSDISNSPAALKEDLAIDSNACHLAIDKNLTTSIKVDVSQKGVPQNEKVVQTSGDPCFDQAALVTAKAAAFYPAMKNNKPISERMVVFVDSITPKMPLSTSGATPPRVMRAPLPDDSACPKRNGAEYQARVALIVDRHGRPTSVTVNKSSGDSCIDASAIVTARHYLFNPAVQGGEPIPFPMQIEMQFNQ